MSTFAAHLSRPVTSRGPALIGAAALAAVAIIHLLDGPGSLEESSAIGLLELALAAATVPLALALVVCPVRDAWLAAGVISAVALGFYLASRTIGLFGMSDDIGNWFTVLGVFNVLSEGTVVALALAVGLRRFWDERRKAQAVTGTDRDMVDGVNQPDTDDAPQTKIVIADDHAVVRSGLRHAARRRGGPRGRRRGRRRADAARATCAPTARTCSCSTSTCRASRACAAIPRSARTRRRPAIVVLTMQDDPAFAREALQAGALGYVLKEAADEELVEAVRLAAAGGTYLNPRLGARIAAAPPEPAGPPDDLTEREVEVLRLIALGHTNSEIAGQLYLSVRTVESHRAHIQQKIRARQPRRARALRARPRADRPLS